IGTYVGVRLDAAATVAPLQDPIVDLQARSLSPKIYVGLITSVYPWYDVESPLLQVEIMLVGQGLPTYREGAVVDASMCTPIFPATEHPLSRQPVRPSKPFPWPNCYQHSFMNKMARVSRIHHSDDSDIRIAKREV
ncbi:hypothetical protein JAAARDRAFT_97076, partial [Jaapia argillacea MUCL 33604]